MEAMFTGEEYVLKIVRLFAVCAFLVHGVFGVEVTVNEGDSLTLHTGFKTNSQDRIIWYFNKTRAAYMYGNQRLICTDDACKEIFMKRLELDSNTGDLSITDVKASDTGAYKLLINSNDRDKTFNVAVHSAPELVEIKSLSVREAESVTLDPSPMEKNANNLMKWHFNETHIAEISEDPSYTCPDVQCDEGNIRFRDRLKLDSQTGSLTITNTRTSDSGEYRLKIIDRTNSFSITTERTFSVNVTDSGPSSATIGGISASVVLLVVFGLIVVAYWWRWWKSDKGSNTHRTLDKVAEGKILPWIRELSKSNVTINTNPATSAEREPLTPPSQARVTPDSYHLVHESVHFLRRSPRLQKRFNSNLQQTGLGTRRRAQTTEDIPVRRVPRLKTQSL